MKFIHDAETSNGVTVHPLVPSHVVPSHEEVSEIEHQNIPDEVLETVEMQTFGCSIFEGGVTTNSDGCCIGDPFAWPTVYNTSTCDVVAIESNNEACNEVDVDGSMCEICFSEPAAKGTFCGRSQCSDRSCVKCRGRCATTCVKDALHTCRWLRCPGCSGRVATSAWIDLVDPSVRAKYESNAEALFNVRCPCCDKNNSLLVEMCALPEQEAWQTQLSDGLGKSNYEILTESWSQFCAAQLGADSFVSEIGEMCRESHADFQFIMRVICSLTDDIERRTSLQLAWHLRYPKIATPCCHRRMCFKCKVDGWHEEQTCEEKQRQECSSDAQSCPGCGASVIKSEGCNHIVCACGQSWTWNGPDPEVERMNELFEVWLQGANELAQGAHELATAGDSWDVQHAQLRMRRAMLQILDPEPGPVGPDWDKELDQPMPKKVKEKRRSLGWFVLILLFLMPALAFLWVLPNVFVFFEPGVRTVGADDLPTVKTIFHGNTPAMVSCVTREGAKKAASPVLLEAQRLLQKSDVKVFRVHCWEPLPLQKGVQTLAQRFGLRDAPPVVLATTGRGKPRVLDLYKWELKSGSQLADRAKMVLKANRK